jgi:hypothetical protein
MNSIKYNMSFIGGGLLRQESVNVAELYLDLKDWDLVKDKVLSENLLQSRTISSAKRFCQEIISRLSILDEDELEMLIESTAQEQGYILWMAICRRYTFVAEFATEVLRERYISLKTDLSKEDFESFMNRKAEWHPEVDKLTPSTKNRVRQIIFRTLREADLLTKGNDINAAMISPALLDIICKHHHDNALYFPVFESDLGGCGK